MIITLQYCDGFLPNINMSQPQVHMCPPHPEPRLPPPSPPCPSRLSQTTVFGFPASCIKLTLVIYFTCGVLCLVTQVCLTLCDPHAM